MLFKHLLLAGALLLSLSACGGETTNTLAEGGIGGSGISMGPITGFGSIRQNGVRYDVSQASFYRDGSLVDGQNRYRVGEVVTIQGRVHADGLTGVADRVEFNKLLQGVVTTASTDGQPIQILGQDIRTDSLTVLHGVNLLTGLKEGNVVEVSGVRDSQGLITASSLTLLQASFTPDRDNLEITGTIRSVDTAALTFMLNGLSIDYSQATLSHLAGGKPTPGVYVRVRSHHSLQGNNLYASEVRGESEHPLFASGTELELEGLITHFIDSNHFTVNGQAVLSTAQTEYEHGTVSDLKLNSTVEVEGVISPDGVLVAEEISIRQTQSDDNIELEGRIDAIDSAGQQLIMQGKTIRVDSRTILLSEVNDDDVSISLSDLLPNDRIEVKARTLADGSLLALRIERESDDD